MMKNNILSIHKNFQKSLNDYDPNDRDGNGSILSECYKTLVVIVPHTELFSMISQQDIHDLVLDYLSFLKGDLTVSGKKNLSLIKLAFNMDDAINVFEKVAGFNLDKNTYMFDSFLMVCSYFAGRNLSYTYNGEQFQLSPSLMFEQHSNNVKQTIDADLIKKLKSMGIKGIVIESNPSDIRFDAQDIICYF